MRLLCVIDMQLGFVAADNAHLQGAIAEVVRSHVGWVAVVAMKGYPPPYSEILEAADPTRTLFVEKETDDGSGAIIRALGERGVAPPDSFVVVGVNTGACVLETAFGLRVAFPEAHIDVPPSLVADCLDGDEKSVTHALLGVWQMAERANRSMLRV